MAYADAAVISVHSIINVLVAFLKNPDDIDQMGLMEGKVAVTNLGMLMSADSSPVLKAVLSHFDIFTIWLLILLTIGLAAVSKNMNKSKAATVTFGLFIIGLVLRVGFAALLK
jgi:hypothetical protein